MEHLQNWIILITVIVGGLIGCIWIVRKRPSEYGLILLISVVLSTALCIFFLISGFYRFVLPLPYILPAVMFSYGFLVLLTIYFKPKKYTFSFFFIVINLVFANEIILKHLGFIEYKNGWDLWDSYTLHWIYVRIFTFIGDKLVSIEFRRPIITSNRWYWPVFYLVAIFSVMAGLAHIF